MGKTVIQKIFENHSKQEANVGDIIDIDIDVRAARDFGGANVVKNLEENNLPLNDSKKTFFTFDCNPGGCDQKYAANQHICRLFARKNDVKVFDIDSSRIELHLRMTPVQTSFEDLSVWPARYFDLLKQTNLRSLLNAASKEYTYVLLYAPYLTVLADRKQIASLSKQAVVFGQRSDHETPSHLHRLLKMCDCEVLFEA